MTPTPAAQPASWGVPLVAAALALLGPAFGFFVFFTQVEGGAEGLASAWAEGGWPMYAAFGASMMLAFFTALFVAFAVRRSAALAIGTPFFAVIPAAIGAAGTNFELNGAMIAVAHVAPADRVTILCAALKEALWCTTFGASLSAGACLALGLSLLVASRAQQKEEHRRALALGGLIAGAFAALSVFGAIASHMVSTAYGVIAYASPSFSIEDMVAHIAAFQAWQGLTAGAGIAVAVVVLLSIALLKAPVPGRIAFAGASIFSALLLFVSVRSKVSHAFEEAVSAPTQLSERLKFDAPTTRESAGLDVGEPFGSDEANRLADNLRQYRDLHEAAGDEIEEATLSLLPEVKAAGLALALRVVVMERFRSVTLLTDPVTPAPSLVPPPFDAVGKYPRGLTLELALRNEACRVECEAARLKDDALWIRGERFPLEKSATTLQQAGEPVFLEATELEPTQLLAAIATASKHGLSLTLLFDDVESLFGNIDDLKAGLSNIPPPPPPPPPPAKKKKKK